MSNAPDTFAALTSRNFRLFFAGHFISSCGTWLQVVAQRWLVWKLTRNEFDLGIVAAATYSSMLLFSILAGSVVDRCQRRTVVLVTQSSAMLLAVLLGFLAMSPELQVWEVAAVGAALGAVNAFDLPARHALVAEMVPREHLVSAVALNQTIFNGARMIGPALAGILLAIPLVRLSDCFFLNALSFLALLVALARTRVAFRTPPHADRSPRAALFDGFRYAMQTPAVGHAILLVMVVGVFGWSALILLPSLADRALGSGDSLYAILMTANGIGAILGTLIVARLGRRARTELLIYGGLAVWCAALAELSLAHGPLLAIAFVGAAGVGMIVFSTTSNVLVQTEVPEALRGRVMAVWSITFAVSEPIGSLQAGAIARALGPAAAIRIGAVAMAVCGTIAFGIARRQNRRAKPHV